MAESCKTFDGHEIRWSSSREFVGDSMYTNGVCRHCGKEFADVWKQVGIMELETGEYVRTV